MSVVLVNCFEVPPGAEEEFFALWQEVNRFMRTQPGYQSHTLYRSLAPDARYRFVNTAVWESATALKAAHGPELRARLAAPEWARFPSTPGVYEAVHAATAGSDPRPLCQRTSEEPGS